MGEAGHEYTERDPVVAQYERWLYPEPVDDLTHPSIAKYVNSFRSLQGLSPFYWPAGQPREDLDILVAGCGTLAGAVYAHLYPRCRVVGIDISRASLTHHQRLKERHRLTNLTLHHLPVEQVASLGVEFDYISCHGVLHHLPDPPSGLRALRGVLRLEGIIAVMLYGKYGRATVYPFQELFRLIGLDQTPQDVAIVKETLGALLPDHPLRWYLQRATDLNSDAGLVDTFLHRRDRPYSAADCAALVRDAGLVFQGWDRNFWYYPDGPLASIPLLRERLDLLPDEQLWHAMDVIVGMIGRHFFYACRADRDPATYRQLWESPRLLDYVPIQRAQLMKRPGTTEDQQWAMGAPQFPPVPLSAKQAAIMSQIDGRRTVRQCLAGAGFSENAANTMDLARALFRLLWRTGFGVLRIPPAITG